MEPICSRCGCRLTNENKVSRDCEYNLVARKIAAAAYDGNTGGRVREISFETESK